MFTKKVTDSDEFIALPASAQALYLHLIMGADDDGFNNQVQLAMFKSHASIDDVKVLLMKRFIIQFENGVIVIKHWRMSNVLRRDRYTPTSFQEELKQLDIKPNGAYTVGCQMVAKRLPDGCQTVATVKDSIVKNSKGKDSKKSRRFTPPTLDEVQAYCAERHSNVDPKQFYDYFTEGNWIDSAGKPVKNWKQKVISWEKRGTGPKISVPEYIEKQERGEYEEEEHLW